MGTEFLRLRRKNALWRILRALLTGIAAGLLLAGGLMAMFKLTTTDGRMNLCLAIGGGAGLFVAIVRWLMLHRSDLRAAEMMDAQHGLRERAQTMIAFREEEGAMAQLQREDAEEKLRAVRSYDIRFSGVAAHVLAVLVAVGVLAGSVILPARAEVEPPVYVEPDFNASAWQKASLEALIQHVKDSNMAEPAKGSTIEELEGLLDTLDTSITVSAFKAQVISVITNVYIYTDRVNSNDDMHDVTMMIDHDIAELLCFVVGSLRNVQFDKDVQDIGYELGKDYNLPTLAKLADDMDAQLARIPANYLSENDYDETDKLYCALLALAAGVREVSEMVAAGETAEAISGRLGEITHDFQGDANMGLELQAVTKEECVYVVETLCSIFSLSRSDCPADPDPTYSRKTEEEDYEGSSGGLGTGDMQYAGNEIIFDYTNNQHVPYTEVINEYYQSMLQAYTEGTLPAEMVDYILKYFNNLYTG